MYSHRRYSNLSKTAFASGTNLTVFVKMEGHGVEWHLYAVDDCVLTHENIPTRVLGPMRLADGSMEIGIRGKAPRTNSIEISTNLFNWTQAAVVTNESGMVLWLDRSTTNLPARYYRSLTR